MTSFCMKDRRRCEVELPSQNGGVYRSFVLRRRENAQGNYAFCDAGVLFFSEESAAFDGYNGYEWSDWFGRSQVENDVGNFIDDNKKYPYLFFPNVAVSVEAGQESNRRAELFDDENGEFIQLLKDMKRATDAFPNYRLDALYKYCQYLLIIPINVSYVDANEETDPFYRLGVAVLNYLYNNRLQYVGDSQEIEALRTALENDACVSDAYRYVLLRMTVPDPKLRFKANVDEIIALCKEKTPSKCEFVKRKDAVVCRNPKEGDCVQFLSVASDVRDQWETLQGKFVPVEALPSRLNEDEDEDAVMKEDGTLWRFEENQGETIQETTKTIIPVAFCRNYHHRPGRWAYVGSILQFSNVPDVVFHETGERFKLTLDENLVLTFHICYPNGIPRCRLTVRADGFADFPNAQEGLLDRLYVCDGRPIQTRNVDLKELGLEFPLYFRIFSETFAPNPGEKCSFSLGENAASRFVIESVEQIERNLVCLK